MSNLQSTIYLFPMLGVGEESRRPEHLRERALYLKGVVPNYFNPEADMGKDHERLSPDMRTYRFGSIAVYRKYVTLGQVQRALAEQVEDDVMRKPHRLLGDILLGNNLITEEQLKSILEEMGLGNK